MAPLNLKKYKMEDVLLTAMKAEVDARDVYRKLAAGVHNAMLKDRLEFLAAEEEKHRGFFEAQFHKDFPDKKICLPEKGVVPLPEVKLEGEDTPLSRVLEQAMDAERRVDGDGPLPPPRDRARERRAVRGLRGVVARYSRRAVAA
jgi:rubrerythrin